MSGAHADAVRTLTAYVPRDEEQSRWREQFLAHLAAHPGATSRDGSPVHLTASVLVLDPTGTSTLLVHHRKAGVWVQPGGHLEPDDVTVAGAALRELAEETGLGGAAIAVALRGEPLELSRHAFAFGSCGEHLDVVHLVQADPSTPLLVSEESDAVAWWPLDALPAGTVDDLPPRLRAASRSQQSAQPCWDANPSSSSPPPEPSSADVSSEPAR